MKTIAYDCTLRRPGCVLVQVGMGATISNQELEFTFDTEDWLLAPTPDMKVYPVTDAQLERLGVITKTREK